MPGLNDPLDPDSPVTAADLRARVEATLSYRALVVARFLIGRPLRRYPLPSWTPHIVVGCLLLLACGIAAVRYLAG